MSVRHWYRSEQAAVDAVAELARLGYFAAVGSPATVELPNGTDVDEWPVDVDISFAEFTAREIERTELDEHDVGRSTLWDEP